MGNTGCEPLHIFLFPIMAHGHIIPVIDMAKLFASRGVKVTIVTTPFNIPLISKAIEQSKTQHCNNNNNIHIKAIKFPSQEVGLPEGCEHMDSVPADLVPAFFNAIRLLQEPFEQLMYQQRPNCIVTDHFFPWSTDSAAKFGIPRLVFHGISFFSLCASELMSLHEPYKSVSSDSELFVIPHLPGEVKMTRLQVSEFFSNDAETNNFNMFIKEVKESDLRSYGVIGNSFYELEPDYADYYREVLGRKAWHIGPFSLCNREKEVKTYRGKEASIDEHECLKWLGKKEINSVVYVCFGSMDKFPDSQLREIAVGLEASGQNFIWVVRRKTKEDGDEWLPEGFEKRIEGKGLIIRGWAPQVLILEHEAIGAFVTHCGWNSTLEGVSAGVPMVTWPLSAEQFYNEKLVTHVLKIGVPVGVKKWTMFTGDGTIKWDAMVKSLKRIMVGEEAKEMRLKVKMLAQKARRAVEDGGSSSLQLDALIEELGSLPH
ncbi:scopoletin glucosyltransferase-like [Lotus japonicus]|uniref:scopoletin glucosyltransferase-like n=1 Tax=Lotus japonicus TaxID=34305 RepID=UPI00258C1642|nr:scopoletin glucosyltransferase-like [Lotus japonicus]